MKFSTPVTDFGSTFLIRPADKLLALGSCFAQVVGQRLLERGADIMLNPTGVLFNPRSICDVLTLSARVAQGKADADAECAKHVFPSQDGRHYSWLASSVISGETREQCCAEMARAIRLMADRLREQTALMLTLGTDHYYALTSTEDKGLAVANCHKMPAAMFEEKTMSVDEIAALLEQTCNLLREINPEFKIIISVSPYRYVKYGLHGSRLSKARLLLAADMLQQRLGEVYYFPAYEILNDELRDYRFYAADMLHPSDVAAEYIWQQFCANYMGDEMRALLRERERELKAAAHRPHNR